MVKKELGAGGKFWNASCNPKPHICNPGCELGKNCWAERYLNTTGKNVKREWNPKALKKINLRGKEKVWAMQWLGDIAQLENWQVHCIFTYIKDLSDARLNLCLPPHTFLILTKWPRLLHEKIGSNYNYVPYYYIGTTITDQKTADERIPELLKFEGLKKKWLCIEPLLGPVNIVKYLPHISQVIVGCETGEDARYTEPSLIRDLIIQCEYTKVPIFVKQVTPKSRLLDGNEYNHLIWGETCL